MKLTMRLFGLILACVVVGVHAIHDPAYNTGIKTKTYRRDPITTQAFQLQQQQTDRDASVNERLSDTNQKQQQQRPHQEIPIYERQSSTAKTTSSNWDDTENAITEYYTGCPAHHTGQLPYAYDCRRYLNCWHGRGHIQTCAPGTVFNPDTLECDHPEKVVCGALLALSESEKGDGAAGSLRRTARYRAGHDVDVSTDNVQLLCPPGLTGLQPHPTDCSKFLNCANGNVHVQNCGPGTAYSVSMMACDYADKVDCGSRGGAFGVGGGVAVHQTYHNSNNYARGRDLAVADILCPANVTGLFPHPFDYTKFLHCKQGNTAIQNCMPEHVFSIARGYCLAKNLVRITEYVSYIVSEVSYEYSQRLTSCPPGTDGQHLYPFDAGKYLKCSNGQMYIIACGVGQAFSIAQRTCLPSQQVVRTDRVGFYYEILDQVTTAHYMYGQQNQAQMYNQNALICPRGVVGLYPFPFDATKYLRCDQDRKLYIETCASGSVFSLSHKQCKQRVEVSITDMVQVQTFVQHGYDEWQSQGNYGYTNYGENMLSFVCPPKVDGIFLHPFDCTKYVECRQGQTMVESCGSGSVYSISRKQCIPRDQVEAFDRVEYLTETQNEFSTESEQQHGQQWIRGSLVQCPALATGPYPHPNDCTKYLSCVSGRTSVENCPAGMVYSHSRRSCDYEQNVQSNDRSGYARDYNYGSSSNNLNQGGFITSITTTASDQVANWQAEDVSCPLGVNGKFTHPRDCTLYLDCVNGVTHVQKCRQGTAWDPQKQICDFKERVNCSGRLGTMPPMGKFDETRRITCPDGLNGFYPQPFDYAQYVICQDGRTVVQHCPSGKAYSISSKRCMPLADVSSTDRVVYSSASWRVTNTAISQYQYFITCPPETTGTYIYPFDCTKYIKCQNGQTSVETCMQGKIFSISKHWCTEKEHVQEADRVGYANELQTVYSWESKYGDSTHGIACPRGVTGLYQHPYDWRKYLVCAEGRTTIESCAPGKVFSVSRRNCEMERKVQAQDRCNKGIAIEEYDYEVTQNSVRGQPPLGSGVQCEPGETGIKPHPHDCNKFLNCANGIVQIQDCGPGTAFSVQLQVCDMRQNVDCSDRTGAPTVNHEGVPEYPKGGALNARLACPHNTPGIYPHPYDCTKFLNCGDGITYVQSCAPGTAWNSVLKVCDFVVNVDCSDYDNESEWSTQGEYSHAPRGGKSYGGHGVHSYGASGSQGFGVSSTQSNQWGYGTSGTQAGTWSQGSPYGPQHSPHYHHSHPQGQYGSTTTTVSASNTNTGGYRDRWSNMDFARPHGFSDGAISGDRTWSTSQQQAGNQGYPHGVTNDLGWSGSGSSVQRVSPTQNVLYEEGSMGPQHTHVQTYSTPLAPFTPTSPGGPSISNTYYGQSGSGSDVQETFTSNSYSGTYAGPPSRPFHTPVGSTLQNWQPNAYPPGPLPMPNPNLMPPPSDPQTVGFQQGITTTTSSSQIQAYPEIPNQQLMPPLPANAQSHPHQQAGTFLTRIDRPSNNHHLKPSLPRSHTDYGQRPLEEPNFSPSQPSYTQSSLGFTQPTPPTADESNLFGGLLPPLPTASQSADTAPPSYLLPPTDATTPLTSSRTERNNVRVFQIYPPVSNASVQQFNRDPHYSPSYAGVAHSRNTSWENTSSRQTPTHHSHTNLTPNTGIKGGHTYHSQNSFNTDFSDDATPYNSQSSATQSTYNRAYYTGGSRSEEHTEETEVDGKQLPISEALRMLLRPYFNRSGTISDETAAQADSHIMNLIGTTTTQRSSASSTSTVSPIADVELILAGEQHSLAHETEKATTTKASHIHGHDNRHNKEFHLKHPDLPNPFTSERSITRPNPIYSPRRDHPHHSHHAHTYPHEHSKDFHLRHPNLPNPFEKRVDNKPTIVEADVEEILNPNAEPTTAPTVDLRGSFDTKTCDFDCGNGQCVKATEICNGVDNCGNRKDESDCKHLGYEVRLTGGESSNMGRVEVKIMDKWGYVCDDKFGLRDADVICRELGFKLGASEVRGNSYYPPTEVNFSYMMDEVDCRGNETSLKDCTFPGWGVNNCGPNEVVGVVCKVPLLKCPNNYWLCSTSKECIPPAFVCDNTPDCADQSDESERVCNSPVEYRLEGGRDTNEGRLEVKYHGEWGTVCDDDFGLKEAQVVCNSLGYYGKPKIEKNIYGPGSGPIWLDQVSCFGNETSIDKCNHWTWGEHNCNHTEDVGIRCTVGPPPRKNTQLKSGNSNDKESSDKQEQMDLEDIGLYSGQWERSSKYLHSQRRCGHFKRNLVDEYAHPEERVVNGTVAKRGRHPWQATIRTRGRGGISSHWCGAVLISKKHLLTAAHCLAGYPKGAYFVRMGDHYANIAEASEVDSYIENWYIHEKFRDQTHMNNDIALVVLKNPVRFNDYIQPICLPDKDSTLKAERLCTISGWGSIKSGVSTPSNILRAAQVPILPDATCKQSHVYGGTMTEGMFCAGYMDESVDACDGDSGGPLVCSDDDGETLYGIISWGQHCGYANKPGVYVRVEKYIDWIYEKINFSMQKAAS